MTTTPDGGLPDRVLPCLEPHFHIHREITGRHPLGNRLRIDAILVPRDPSQWARPDIALGVEFKRRAASGRKDSSKVIRQCMDYTITDWKGFGVGLPIFFCPGFDAIEDWRVVRNWRPYTSIDDGFLGQTVATEPLTSQQWHRAGMGYAISGILGQHNVGELIHRDCDGWSFIKHGGGFHVQWCERRGVCEARRNQNKRIVGSG